MNGGGTILFDWVLDVLSGVHVCMYAGRNRPNSGRLKITLLSAYVVPWRGENAKDIFSKEKQSMATTQQGGSYRFF